MKVKEAGRPETTWLIVDLGRRIINLDVRLQIAVYEQIESYMQYDSRWQCCRNVIAVLLLVEINCKAVHMEGYVMCNFKH